MPFLQFQLQVDVVKVLLQDVVIHNPYKQYLFCPVIVDQLHKLVLIVIQQNVVVVIAICRQ